MKTKQQEELVKLDVKIISSIYPRHPIAGEYAIYEVELLNANEIIKDDLTEFEISRSIITKVTGTFDRRYFMDEEMHMYGTYYYHPKFQDQYKVQFVKTKMDTPERIKQFLMMFCAENIAKQLMDKHGIGVVDVILNDELDYSDIHGMGEVRFKALQEKLRENEYLQDLIIALSDYGVTPLQMKKIANLFGAGAVVKIEENPYILCQVNGIGFLRADEIAKKMGYDMESPNRIREAIKYTIAQNGLEGHTWISRVNLLKECKTILKMKEMSLIDAEIENTEGIIIVDKTKVALEKVYEYEQKIAERLIQIQFNSSPLKLDVNEFVAQYTERYPEAPLTEEQVQFFHNLQQNNVNYLIGYAGCGKSYLQRLANMIFKTLRLRVRYLAPTGKASKVLGEYIGEEAYTIHRALKWMGEEKANVYLMDDVIVVDESSMADVNVMSVLLEALKNPNVRVIFIGDDFQIPSVGAGNYLYDCNNVGEFPITKLTKVFRQKDGGALDVITNVRLKQKFIEDDFVGRKLFGKDCIIHSVAQKFMIDGYKHYYKDALKAGYSIDDIVVLSPTKKGSLGTVAVNKEIQEIVNPASPDKLEIQYGHETIFREGDRIINTRNLYRLFDVDDEERMSESEITVVNGDIGIIEKINKDNQTLIINYGFARIEYTYGMLDNITHSYCLTIHKSQGSGFKYVIVLADKAHIWQMNANLLYTAMTRMKEQLVVLCQANVINSAMKKNISLQRNTFLQDLIKKIA